jgi:hypothetical protein
MGEREMGFSSFPSFQPTMLRYLSGNNEWLPEWTNGGKQRFKLLDRYGGYVAFR